ncbi:spore coat protein [Salipaludibacillus aurantiacus]|uniref:Coat F domain-containing protein n=1 Tax=Salipaludibacillus aurantiacus TaxID=1601833 RepID=A0A1H9TX80_9BACI|nr:spore coat protein [Salipaludibacillus aurantiacus]SES01835.1 Coat F domain-containing protein [Salipaludibacillus aurantiacus]
MPNNIEGRGLTDREMLQLCLELEKGRCRSAASTLLETSHEQLREVYQRCFNNARDSQYAMYNLMNSKGWYIQSQASREEVGRVQEEMQNNLHPDDQFLP